MAESFSIVFSKVLSLESIVSALAELIRAELRINVQHDVNSLPDDPGAIWALLEDTDDASWPCVLKVMIYRPECGLGAYPDLKIASHIGNRYRCNVLCGTYPFVGELDPHDPYWSLAWIDGEWYLVSTAGTRLMGPYTNGKDKFPGNDSVRMIRPIAIPPE